MKLNEGFQGHERDLEKGLPYVRTRVAALSESAWPPLPSSPAATPTRVMSNSGKAPMVSSSGKWFDGQSSATAGKKKYVRLVTGRHYDTGLHLAVQRGDLASVMQIMAEIEAQMVRPFGNEELNAEVAEIRSAIVNEVIELGETPLFTAAKKGHLNVVKELLKYSAKEGIYAKNGSGFDPLHIAASQGHQGKRNV